jgi:hypothetical protein
MLHQAIDPASISPQAGFGRRPASAGQPLPPPSGGGHGQHTNRLVVVYSLSRLQPDFFVGRCLEQPSCSIEQRASGAGKESTVMPSKTENYRTNPKLEMRRARVNTDREGSSTSNRAPVVKPRIKSEPIRRIVF